MAELIKLPTFGDDRGQLTVLEKTVPFDIKRTFLVYDVKDLRGGHRHHKNRQVLIAVAGTVEVYVNDGKTETTFVLDNRDKCLLVEPDDWHTMKFSNIDAVLLVFASEFYDVNDYIDEKY